MNDAFQMMRKQNTTDDSKTKNEENKKKGAYIHSNTIDNSMTRKFKEAIEKSTDKKEIKEESLVINQNLKNEDDLVESKHLEENNQFIINHLDVKINQKFDSFEMNMRNNLAEINQKLNDYNQRNIENFARVEGKIDEVISYNF